MSSPTTKQLSYIEALATKANLYPTDPWHVIAKIGCNGISPSSARRRATVADASKTINDLKKRICA